jgi:CubicO group peptidase (beta-lactamase class C family)
MLRTNLKQYRPKTLFCVASMSKAFTSASVGILMSQLNQSHSQSACSPFDWTSKVHSILPPSKWKLQSEWSTQKANLIDILSHSSGLPRHDASYAPGDSLDQLVERMRDLKMAWELREHYSYNNQVCRLDPTKD